MANPIDPFAGAQVPFSDVGMIAAPGETASTAPPSRPNVFTSGISAGAYGALGDVGTLGEALGRATGWQGLQNAGAGFSDWARQWGQAVGRPDLDQQGWFDNGASGFLTKGAYEASKMIPLGLAGMLTGGAAPEASLLTRAALGAAPMFPSAVAGQYESAKQAPGGATADDALRSLAFGGPLSLIQGFAPAHISANLAQKVTGNFWARVGRESLVGGAAGAVGAGSQAAANVAFRDDMDPAAKRQQIIDSTIQGGVMTGLLGGGVAAVRGKTEGIAPQTSNDAISQAIDSVVGPSAQQAPAFMPQSDAPQRAQQAYGEATAGMPGGQANLIPEFLQRFNKGADQPQNPVTQSVEQYYRDMVSRGGPPENPTSVVPYDPAVQPRDPMYNRQGFTNWYDVTDPAQFLTSVRGKRAQPDLGPGATEPVTLPPEAPGANVVPFDNTRTALAPQQGREVGTPVNRFQRLLPDSQANNPLEFYNEVLDRVNGGHITADVAKLAETFGIGRDLNEELLQAQHSGDDAEAARIQKQIMLRDASLKLRENPAFRAQLEQQHMAREIQSTPETTQPRSTIEQVEQYVKENSIPGAEVVPHKQIMEALSRSPEDGGPGLAPGDIRAALIALHNDPDNGFEMRNGKGSTAGSIMVDGKMLRGMRYTGSEDLRDAVQKPSSAGVDVQEPPADGARVGSGNPEGFEPARARADQIQEQAPAPDEGARASDIRQGIQDGTVNPIPLPEDARADVDDVMNNGASSAARKQLEKIMNGIEQSGNANGAESLGGGQPLMVKGKPVIPGQTKGDVNASKIGNILHNNMSRGMVKKTGPQSPAQAQLNDTGLRDDILSAYRSLKEPLATLEDLKAALPGRPWPDVVRELTEMSKTGEATLQAKGLTRERDVTRKAGAEINLGGEARHLVGFPQSAPEPAVQEPVVPQAPPTSAPASWTPPAEPFKGTSPGVKKDAESLGGGQPLMVKGKPVIPGQTKGDVNASKIGNILHNNMSRGMAKKTGPQSPAQEPPQAQEPVVPQAPPTSAPASWTPPAEPFKGTFPGVKKAAEALGVNLPDGIGPKDKRWPLLEDQMTSAWNAGRRSAWDSPTFTNAKTTIDGILGEAGDMKASAAARQAQLDAATAAEAQVAEANRERTKEQTQRVTLAQLTQKFLGDDSGSLNAPKLGELFSRFLGDDSGSLNINNIGFSRAAGQIRSNSARYKNANMKPPEPTVPQALDRVGDTGTFTEALGQLVNNADNMVRRAMRMSTDPMARKDSALRQAFQTLDKFKDLQGYETEYDQRMDGNIGVIRSEKQNTRTIHQQLSQAPTKVLNASWEALRKLSYFPEVQRMLGTMTEFGVDPFRPLTEQPHLDGMPDVQRVRAAAAHAEMQAVVNKLAQTPGGVGIQQVQNLIQLGRVQRYQDVTNLHGMVAQSYPEVPLPPSPGRTFMQDVAARNNLTAREKFMQKAASDTYAAVDQFLTSGRQNAIASGLAATADLKPLPGESPLAFAERKNGAANETLKAFDQQYESLIDAHSRYGKMLTEATLKPYFSMAHSGPYMVSFHLPAAEDGTPDIAKTRELQDRFTKEGFGSVGLNPLSSQPHVMASFENPTVMQRFADLVADAREAGLVDKDKPIYNGPKSRADNFGATALPIMQRMVDNLANSPAFKPKPGADPETVARMAAAQKEAVESLRASLMDQMPDNSLVRADSLRANVQGYDKQMYRSIAKRQEQSNAAMANMTTLQSRLQAMSKMQDIVDAAKAVPGAAGAKNAIELQNVLNGVRERAQPQSAASANGFWNSAMNKFMGIAHSVMIGVSPGYHILQMSQILTRLFPILVSKQNVSPVAAFNAIARNTPMAYKVMSKIISSGDAVTLDDLTRMGMKQPQAQAFLKVLNDGQISASTFSNQLNAQAQGSMPTSFSKLQHMANSTASWSETVPRIIAALAAHDIHTNRFNADQQAKISAPDYMNSVVRGSMYDWGDETQLPAVRALGPFGKLAGQFHQYQAKSLNQYYQMALGAFGKGGVPQAEALRWIGAHAAAVMTLSGTLGLPMLGWMADAVTKASGLFNQGESYDVKAHFRNYVAAMMGEKMGDVVAHGLPSLAGWATGKYGDAELAPFSRLLEDRRKMEDSLPDYLANANGATINYGANILMGARDMINGQWAKGTARMMPTALRSAINAYKMSENGYTNAQGQTIEVSPDARDIMLTALGLKPADIEKHQEKAASTQGAREEAEYRATLIKQNLAMAFERNQPEQAQKWQAEAQAYDADPAHFNRRILPGFMSYYQNRQKALAYARATGLPLGTPQTDYNAHNLTRY